MYFQLRFPSLLLGICLLFCPSGPVGAHEAGTQMAAIAKVFIAALPSDQKAKACFEFATEERENWHFIPRERKGLSMKEMSPQQQLLAHALLNTGLSFRGSAKAVTIMSLEEVLYQIEGADETIAPGEPLVFATFGEDDAVEDAAVLILDGEGSASGLIKGGELDGGFEGFFSEVEGQQAARGKAFFIDDEGAIF